MKKSKTRTSFSSKRRARSRTIKRKTTLRKGMKRWVGTRGKRGLKKRAQHPGSYNKAYDEGFDSAYNEGFNIGYQEGMEAGHQEAAKGA